MASTLAGPLLQLTAAAVAAYGAWRCVHLQRLASDRRLTVLALFFGLFAAAVALHAVWELSSGAPGAGPGRDFFGGGAPLEGAAGNGTRGDDRPPPFRPEGPERVDLWLALSHALMLASLVIAVWAFGRRRDPGPEATSGSLALLALAPGALAASPFMLVGELVPLMLGAQAGLTLYLAIRAALNHVERRSPGALQVALGFLLFFLGHLTIYVQHTPGMGRSELGDVLNLVGVVLLVQALPGRR